MKKLIIIIALVFFSCSKDEIITITNSIQNNSGKNLVIKTYMTNEPSELIKEISIANYSSYVSKLKLRESDGIININQEIGGDSAVVYYNNNERK